MEAYLLLKRENKISWLGSCSYSCAVGHRKERGVELLLCVMEPVGGLFSCMSVTDRLLEGNKHEFVACLVVVTLPVPKVCGGTEARSAF